MEIKDQRSRSFIKIIGIELDHQKYQDHLGDLGSCRSKIMIFTQLWFRRCRPTPDDDGGGAAVVLKVETVAFLLSYHSACRILEHCCGELIPLVLSSIIL